jgi:Domain of unknown function (DUF4282)
MRCVECFFDNPIGTEQCKSCGANLTNDKRPAAAEDFAIEAAHERRGFFSFGTFISPTVIQAIYILGAAAISLAGLLMVALALTGLAPEYTDTSRDTLIVGGLTLLAGGNILWRVLCEIVILLFRMHEALAKLDDKARVLIALLAERK